MYHCSLMLNCVCVWVFSAIEIDESVDVVILSKSNYLQNSKNIVHARCSTKGRLKLKNHMINLTETKA